MAASPGRRSATGHRVALRRSQRHTTTCRFGAPGSKPSPWGSILIALRAQRECVSPTIALRVASGSSRPRDKSLLDAVAQVLRSEVDVPDRLAECGVLDGQFDLARQVDVQADAGRVGQEDVVALVRRLALDEPAQRL